jgi:hypothetical protein
MKALLEKAAHGLMLAGATAAALFGTGGVVAPIVLAKVAAATFAAYMLKPARPDRSRP